MSASSSIQTMTSLQSSLRARQLARQKAHRRASLSLFGEAAIPLASEETPPPSYKSGKDGTVLSDMYRSCSSSNPSLPSSPSSSSLPPGATAPSPLCPISPTLDTHSLVLMADVELSHSAQSVPDPAPVAEDAEAEEADLPPQDAELSAFLAWLSLLSLSPPNTPSPTLTSLTDGTLLLSLLSRASTTHFPLPARQLSPSDPWPLRLTQLKALYRRVAQWYAERSDTLLGLGEKDGSGEEWVPSLQLLVDTSSPSPSLAEREREVLKLLRLVVGVAVQGEEKEEAVGAIRELRTDQQTLMMRAIERVMAAFPPRAEGAAEDADTSMMTDDDHYYSLQSARSRLQSENTQLHSALQALQVQVDQLQTQASDLQAEKDDALQTARELRAQAEERRGREVEAGLRGEIERLKDTLRTSEDTISSLEGQVQRQERDLSDISRRALELQEKADSAGRLKDQVDELRHAAERAQKNENVIEKYKRKLEETADLRRQVKTLTEQNTQLVNTNSQLEAQSSKSANVKPLLDAYKQQISELESKASARAAEVEGLRVKLEEERRARVELDRLREQERREAEGYAERVRELESGMRVKLREGWGGEEPLSPGLGLGEAHETEGEALTLDDALSGTTMTDLKLRIRALERELLDAQQENGTASRVLVLENLLEDANRLKARYEKEYLAAHREALVLRREVEEIRAGKGGAESGEMVIAVRKRLNELVEELDGTKKSLEEKGVELDSVLRELTVAKSDLNLVNKDQLEILASLRASVSSDNAGLSAELDRLKQVERELREKNRMQMEQVNGLLMEKIELQGEGIGQREAMLKRERDIGDLRASIAGKDLPEETKRRLIDLADENARLKEEIKLERQKLVKARQFIKDQDELFSKQHAGKVDPGTFTEAEKAYKSQIGTLEDKIALLTRTIKENAAAYDREKQQLQSSFRVLGSQQRQTQLRTAASRTGTRLQPQSWLAQQREHMMANLSR